MEITPRELRDTEIAEAFRGYNRDVVNDMLERAASALEAANERLRQMIEQVNSAQAEAGRTRETEDILHRTLLLAQRAADEAVAEAQQKARQMLDEAEITSRKLTSEAEADARRRGEAERRRLEEEVLDLAGRRDALFADVEAMSRFEADYRERMVRALEADLTALRTRPPAAPGARPEPTDVELPSADAMARGDAPAPASAPGDQGPAVDVRAMIDQQVSQASTLASAPAAEPTIPESAEASSQPPRHSQVDAQGDAQGDAQFDAQFDALREASFSPRTESPEPPTEASGQPAPDLPAPDLPVRDRPAIDLEAPDPDATDADANEVEAEVLDDDAFFATLREAVHDDAPLGPRDDDHLSFFDQEDDADRGSFRDVFRRRR